MSKIIGIDLGTTNSVVAAMEGGSATVITNPEGPPGDPLGRRHQRQGRTAGGPGRQAPGRHQPREHRLLDEAFHGTHRFDEVQNEIKMVPFKVEAAENGDVRVKIRDKAVRRRRRSRRWCCASSRRLPRPIWANR